MNSRWYNLRWAAGVGSQLAVKELRQNRLVYLAPVLFFLPVAILSILSNKPVFLGAKPSIIGLVIAFIFAVIFGLQGFAGETDRKTIDFLLSRPVSPTLLIIVKFIINLGIYMLWLLLIVQRIHFDWSILKLPEGVSSAFIIFVFPIILSMGFFSGLVTRGAERLVVTIGLAALMAGGSYFLWNQAFTLMGADFYFPDIPPHIIALISLWLPGLLLIVSLATPLVFALWFLRGRYFFYRFKPFRRLLLIWAAIVGAILFAVTFLGPAVWPIFPSSRGGDWHPRSGVAIAGTYFAKDLPLPTLYIARIGGKARPVYQGTEIHSARWSPDGQQIAFVDGPWIKVWSQSGVRTIVKGSFPYWSQDGKRIAFVRNPSKHQEFTGVYVVEVNNKSVKRLFASPKLRILGLVWDSMRSRLYILHDSKLDGLLEVVNLRTNKAYTIKALTHPPAIFMWSPTMTMGASGQLFLGVNHEHEAHVLALNPNTKEFSPLDDSQAQGIDMLSQTIISPTGNGYLVPRMDGAFDYKGYTPPHKHHDGDDDEHESGTSLPGVEKRK